MLKTVRIIGLAKNVAQTPLPKEGEETWISNNHQWYNRRLPWLKETNEWTRWFNLHSKRHMMTAYPKGWAWYQQQTKPVYLREAYPEVPASIKFPREAIQNYFGGSQLGSPGRYFTFTGGWLIALAIMEGFERIEFWGFRLADKPARPHECYKFERPCFFYWVKRARDLGIEVTYQPEVEAIPFEPGDPATYTGPLYGFETSEPFE